MLLDLSSTRVFGRNPMKTLSLRWIRLMSCQRIWRKPPPPYPVTDVHSNLSAELLRDCPRERERGSKCWKYRIPVKGRTVTQVEFRRFLFIHGVAVIFKNFFLVSLVNPKGLLLPTARGQGYLGYWKELFPVRVRRPWHRVPREAVAAPGSLEVSKARLDIGLGAPWDSRNCPCPWQSWNG